MCSAHFTKGCTKVRAAEQACARHVAQRAISDRTRINVFDQIGGDFPPYQLTAPNDGRPIPVQSRGRAANLGPLPSATTAA